jgi:ubiquinone/menaquinone biosynthesis C-methylase UbiE
MALTYKIRDARLSRQAFLDETGIKPGNTVLDYGCGPGSYVVKVAGMVGEGGHVYALDRQPLALRMVSEAARHAHVSNVTTILSDGYTGLPSNSVDVLKPTGILSSHDHHLKEDALRQAIESSELFTLARSDVHTMSFSPLTR